MKKIVLRHIFASAFSFFWSKNPEYFEKEIGKFMELSGFDKIEEYLEKKPEDLKRYCAKRTS